MAAILDVKDLDVGFGNVRILSGVSFSLEAGELAVLCGNSGSGKSALLRTLAGFVAPMAGRIDSGDAGNSAAIRTRRTWLVGEERDSKYRMVAYAPQHANLFPNLSGEENLAFDGAAPRWARRDLFEIAKKWGLTGALGTRSLHLSKGQAQRISVLRVLSADARLILLDEPTASLDRASAVAVAETIGELLAERADVCVVVATHDWEFAGRVGTRFLSIREDRVVEFASLAQAFGGAFRRHIPEVP